jgi:tape measure domain-containing protein
MKIYEYLVKIRAQGSENLDKIRNASGAAETSVSKLNTAFGGLGTAVAGLAIGAGLLSAGNAVFDLGVKMEQTRVSFTTFLGDADKANATIAKLNEFSNVTPFDNDTVIRAGKSLLAFGTSAEALPDTLRKIGDISAGTGKNFNELATIYGKARIAGTLYAEDINQLVEAGVPIMGEFAKALGTTEDNVKKMASEGKLKFKDLENAFTNLTGKGGMFFDLMAKQSETVGGKMSTFKGKMQTIGIAIGESMGKAVAPFLTSSIKLLDILIPAQERESAILSRQKNVAEGLFSVLEKGNLTTEQRAVVLDKINTQYAPYLDHLLTEKTSLHDIAKAHDSVTDSLKKKIEYQYKAELQSELLGRQAKLMFELIKIDNQKIGIKALNGVKDPIQRKDIAYSHDIGGLGSTQDIIRLTAAHSKITSKINGELDDVKKKLSMQDAAFLKLFEENQAKSGLSVDKNGSLVDSLGDDKSSSSSTDLKEGVDSINGGGTRHTNITITLGNLIGEQSITVANSGEAVEDMRDKVEEALLRVLNSANMIATQ